MLSKGKFVSTKGIKTKKPSETGVPDIGTPDKYELFLRRKDVIEVLLTLEVGNKKMRSTELMNGISRDDLLYFGDYLGGAQHGLNRVFSASANAPEGLRLPFYARARGNVLQIGRISQVFDRKNYSMEEGGYEKPKDAQRLRVEKWLKELADVGIMFEVKGQWKPLSNEEAHKLVEKIPANMNADTENWLEVVKEEYIAKLEEKAIAEKEVQQDEPIVVEDEVPKHSITTAMRDGSNAEKAESTG